MAFGYRTTAPAHVTFVPDSGSIKLFGLMTFYVNPDMNKLVDCFTVYVVCSQLFFCFGLFGLVNYFPEILIVLKSSFFLFLTKKVDFQNWNNFQTVCHYLHDQKLK